MRGLFYSIIVLSFFVPELAASASEGKEVYSRVCSTCHPYAKDMASKKTSQEWKRVFKHQDGNDLLTKMHLSKEEAKSSWKYFKDEDYKQQSRHLRDFMLKNSSDRAKHSSCF